MAGRLEQGQRLHAALGAEAKQGIALLGMNCLELEGYLQSQLGENIFLMPVEEGMVRGGVSPVGVHGSFIPSRDGGLPASAENALERMACLQSPYEELELLIGQAMPPGPGRAIAQYLAASLDEAGYLVADIEEVGRRFGVPANMVEHALGDLQSLVVPGVGARSLSECLMLQLAAQGEDDSLAAVIVRGYLDLLAAGDFDALVQNLHADSADVHAAAAAIRALDPRPGLHLGGFQRAGVVPEVVFAWEGGTLVVEVVHQDLLAVQVNEEYAALFESGAFDAAARAQLGAQLKRARALASGIESRRSAIAAVSAVIARKQHGYFAQGAGALQPLTMTSVAADVGCSVSTVSRIAGAVHAQTPFGQAPLRLFFSQGRIACHAEGAADGFAATADVLGEIRRAIASEDRRNPLSDGALSALLDARGYRVARRTVAKYRKELGFPPCAQRRAASA